MGLNEWHFREAITLCLKHLVPKVDVCSSVIVGQKYTELHNDRVKI